MNDDRPAKGALGTTPDGQVGSERPADGEGARSADGPLEEPGPPRAGHDGGTGHGLDVTGVAIEGGRPHERIVREEVVS